MNKQDKAILLMKEGSSCAQAVFTVFTEEFGLDEKDAHKLMTAFGGGMAKKQFTCGAISGGVAVLNMRYGSEVSSDKEAKMLAYEKVYEFIDTMEKQFGHSDCRNLLGYDMRDAEAAAKAKEDELTAKICHPIVKEVVAYLEKDSLK